MSQPWVAPKPGPVDSISPSGLNALIACPKRFAYQRDNATRAWARDSPASCLGTVAHRLTERVARGEAPEGPERAAWLRRAWDQLVADQVAHLRSQWPGRDVPPPSAWRGYAATKVRLLRRLATTSGADGAAPAAPAPVDVAPVVTSSHTYVPPLPWVERTLRDQSRRMHGTPDRVDDVDGEVRVVDLKSGLQQGDITDPQLRQLLFYAHLVTVTLGRRPEVGVVLTAKGDEVRASLTAHEIDGLVSLVKESLHGYESGLDAAAPSADACRWCPFRVVCQSYWDAVNAEWGYFPGLCGEVVACPSSTEVVVQLTRPDPESQRQVRLVLATVEDVLPGDAIVAVDVDSAGTDTYRTRWNSRLRTVRC